MRKRLKTELRGTRLYPSRDLSGFEYGSEGTIHPGHFEFVWAFGDPTTKVKFEPNEGTLWIKDESARYWQVVKKDILDNYEVVD